MFSSVFFREVTLCFNNKIVVDKVRLVAPTKCVVNPQSIISKYDFYISMIMGVFTIGLGIALVTWASPFLPAAEVSILVLLESILGPVWVWLFLGEIISFAELVGGFTVISAVILMVYKTRSV